jgi:hypothetical protein
MLERLVAPAKLFGFIATFALAVYAGTLVLTQVFWLSFSVSFPAGELGVWLQSAIVYGAGGVTVGLVMFAAGWFLWRRWAWQVALAIAVIMIGLWLLNLSPDAWVPDNSVGHLIPN